MDMLDPGVEVAVNNCVVEYTLANQDRLSAHEVIRRHHRQLLVWLGKRLMVAEDAYDVAQESYIKLLKYEGSADIRSAWAVLQKIALNVAYDLGRTRRSHQEDLHCSIDEVDLVSDAPSIERILEAEQTLIRVMLVIENLPPRCREIFLLSRMENLTYAEIANCCNISVKMVEKHISHALMVCARCLD